MTTLARLAAAMLLALVTAGATGAATVGVRASADRAALQRALDRARPGDTVLLSAGLYLVDRPVRLRSGVALAGAGMGLSVLRLAAAGPGLLIATDAHDLRLSDLSLQGAGQDDQAEEHGAIVVRLTSGRGDIPVNLTVERVRASGFRSCGVVVLGTGQAVATDVTIRDCVFQDLGFHGVLGYFVRRCRVQGCRFLRLGRSGTIFARCWDVWLRDCQVRTTGWHGLEVGDETEGFCIEGNVIEDSGDHAGILAEQAAHRGVIAFNRVLRPRFQGIQLNNKPAVAAIREVAVTGNFIEMPAATERPAILAYGDTTFTLDDCHFSGNTILGGGYGIEAHYLKRCRFADNVIRGARQGLALFFADTAAITGNLVADCAAGALSVAPYAEVFRNRELLVCDNLMSAGAAGAAATAIALRAVQGATVQDNRATGFARPLSVTDCADLTTDLPY